MPLAAYFRNVGAVLLALLLLANFTLTAPPVVQRETVYPPVIRIHSDRKWPEAVILDTTMVIASAKPVAAEAEIAASPVVDDGTASRTEVSNVRDAFAMLPRQDPLHARAVPQNKRHLKQKTAAGKYARHRIMLASRQRPFGWFDSRYW